MAPDAATESCFLSVPVFHVFSTYCNSDFSVYHVLNYRAEFMKHVQLLAFAVTEQISDSV